MNFGAAARTRPKPWTWAWGVYSRWWWKRAKERAWDNPTWADIEQRRQGSGHWIMLSDKARLGTKELATQRDVMDRISPQPWPFHVRWWLEAHGYSAQRSKLRRAQQRAARGWANSDTWRLDLYLAQVITGSIDHLRSLKTGHPSNITFEEWQDILARIADGFRPLDNTDPGDDATMKAKRDEAFRLLAEWFRDLWD